jgi:hypothetical protein
MPGDKLHAVAGGKPAIRANLASYAVFVARWLAPNNPFIIWVVRLSGIFQLLPTAEICTPHPVHRGVAVPLKAVGEHGYYLVIFNPGANGAKLAVVPLCTTGGGVIMGLENMPLRSDEYQPAEQTFPPMR